MSGHEDYTRHWKTAIRKEVIVTYIQSENQPVAKSMAFEKIEPEIGHFNCVKESVGKESLSVTVYLIK